MNTARTHAQFIIGSDTLTDPALRQIVANISAKYGGCTVTHGDGMWAEDGDKFGQPDYRNIATEQAFIIDICTTPDEFDLEYLKDCFMPALGAADWIHCEVWETQGLHFSLNERNVAKQWEAIHNTPVIS